MTARETDIPTCNDCFDRAPTRAALLAGWSALVTRDPQGRQIIVLCCPRCRAATRLQGLERITLALVQRLLAEPEEKR